MFQQFTYVDFNFVQVAHTLLSMVDPLNGQPFFSSQKRLFVFAKMLQSAVPQSLSWVAPVSGVKPPNLIASGNKEASGTARSFILCFLHPLHNGKLIA
jgi:hypothetical protein